MKNILIVFLMLSGCATLNGQVKFNKTTTEPVITEHIVEMPVPEYDNFTMASGAGAITFKYWEMPINKFVDVSNGFNKPIHIAIDCNYTTTSGRFEFDIPAHTTQEIMISTIAKYGYDKLCKKDYYYVK